MASTAFTAQLDEAALAFLKEVNSRPFSGQAVAFLNAYWPEVKEQAEIIYSVFWDWIKYADMHAKGISLLHLYTEGADLDFDIGLYFYECLCKFLEDPKNAKWTQAPYDISQIEMMTALKRKQCLRDKVDVDFDGRISFLEFLLFEYVEVANPADFCSRSMGHDEHPEVRAARLALEEVNEAIRAYEAEKSRLEQESQGTGVRALRATNELAQLGASPLAERLNESLIKAEAALRRAAKKFGSGGGGGGGDSGGGDSQGAMWWMQRDLQAKKEHYGKK